jgi:signal transduction histidine kinase
MTTNDLLRILIVEDLPSDAELAERELRKGEIPFTSVRVDTKEAFLKALVEFRPDLIVSDYAMPEFDGMQALQLSLARDPRLPFIILTGSMNEETAVDCMKAGATDYVIKNRITRLPFAVKEALDKKAAEASLQAKNEELNTVMQQLLQATKLATMGELASSIAHELNNPLAIMSLRIESLMAQTGKADPRQRELEIIGHEVERMGNLVTNLLQFSRRNSPQISTVDVCEEIEKTFELIHYHFRKYNIRVVREFVPGVPKIIADRQQLRQLFLNLFTNAGDAMPGGGTITIRVTALTERKKVCIEIADTGIGIPPEVLPHVMESFYTTKPEGKGTGLGLAICRRIAQEHRGTLTIMSEGIPGKGTTVSLELSSIERGNGLAP